jgi:hypothetical protein
MKSLALLLILLTPISIAVCREPVKSKLEVMTVHSAGLQGNAFGDSADQQVAEYLPPGTSTAGNDLPSSIYCMDGRPSFASVAMTRDLQPIGHFTAYFWRR